MAKSRQVSFEVSSGEWRVGLSTEWDVLGPFPMQAREQNLLSPSFPINLSKPVDLHATWHSSYASGAKVSWSKAYSDEDGQLKVSFPSVRWEQLRATEGWVILQYHSILRTSLTLYPPSGVLVSSEGPKLLVNLVQGSFFSVLPGEDSISIIPEWHAGNIYAMERAVPRTVSLPVRPSLTHPTKYHIFVSGDYEIRLFGDPSAYFSKIPVLSINLSVNIETPEVLAMHVPSHDVACDFVDGVAFGEAFGIGLRSALGWITVKNVVTSRETHNVISVELLRQTKIAPSQTRIIPVKVVQHAPYHLLRLRLDLTAETEEGQEVVIPIVIQINHCRLWDRDSFSYIKASYFYAESMATSFIVIPPEEPGKSTPPLLALHGAGVDIFASNFWAEAIPRQKRSWVVIPSGRTSWGLDWHGPSTQDAWNTLDALRNILSSRSEWKSWALPGHGRVVILGHSNGGQGAWYIASRHPDKVCGVIPAAGYIKSQAYVPLTHSRSAHFVDPALRAILDTSLTPDDNDLFLTNLLDVPILAIHGGDDNNVPTWHSREAYSIIKSWRPDARIRYKEDPGQSHWYPSVFRNDDVRIFLDSVADHVAPECISPESFILTVSLPHESGSLHGWRIETLRVPGRLARIQVQTKTDRASVKTLNVRSFTVDLSYTPQLVKAFVIDETSFSVDRHSADALHFTLGRDSWIMNDSSSRPTQLSGRMQAVLTSSAPLNLIVADDPSDRSFSIALRIAHDLDTYHKIDSKILQASELLAAGKLDRGNSVLIGEIASPHVQFLLQKRMSPFVSDGTSIQLHNHDFSGPSLGILFLHPHLTNPEGNILVLTGTDGLALERVARLFPIRTGIAVPDWIVVGPESENMGAGGVSAAGIWGDNWTWNGPMSWL